MKLTFQSEMTPLLEEKDPNPYDEELTRYEKACLFFSWPREVALISYQFLLCGWGTFRTFYETESDKELATLALNITSILMSFFLSSWHLARLTRSCAVYEKREYQWIVKISLTISGGFFVLSTISVIFQLNK